jgi:hypothetical protein
VACGGTVRGADCCRCGADGSWCSTLGCALAAVSTNARRTESESALPARVSDGAGVLAFAELVLLREGVWLDAIATCCATNGPPHEQCQCAEHWLTQRMQHCAARTHGTVAVCALCVHDGARGPEVAVGQDVSRTRTSTNCWIVQQIVVIQQFVGKTSETMTRITLIASTHITHRRDFFLQTKLELPAGLGWGEFIPSFNCFMYVYPLRSTIRAIKRPTLRDQGGLRHSLQINRFKAKSEMFPDFEVW